MKTLSVLLLWAGAIVFHLQLEAFQQLPASKAMAGATVEAQPDTYPQSELRSMIERYRADRGNISRYYDIPFSVTRRKRMKEFYAGWLSRLARLNFDNLSQDGRIDYLLFHNHLQNALRQLDHEAKQL
jgi:hypothetical protein